MDVFQAIAQRYSYRDEFVDQPVPREHLRAIVHAGLQAPSGKNAQTTRFVIVDDPALLAAINEVMPANAAVRTARAMIACVIDKRPEAVYEGYAFQVEDCAAAVENILLALTALGYASVWIDGRLRLERNAARIGELLGVPDDKVVRILLPVGVPVAPGPRREKLPFEHRAWFNRYAC
jgi:nitroreductase